MSRDKNGLTPFHHACISSYVEKEFFDVREAKRRKTQHHHFLPPKVPNRNEKHHDIDELNFEMNPSNLRQEVLQLLHKYGEESSNILDNSIPVKLSRDAVSGWNICHWLAFNNDLDCFKFLESKDFDQFWVPNQKGEFPIDIAGNQGNRDLVHFLITKIKTSDFAKETPPPADQKKSQYKDPDFLETSLVNRFRGSLVVIYHYMYWACKYPSESSDLFVKDVLEKSKANRIYLEYPIHALKNQTLFHAVCFYDNFSIAKLLMKSMRAY